MTKLKQYRTRTDDDGDIVCSFEFYSTDVGVWLTEIVYDPLQSKVIDEKGRCDCPAQKFQSFRNPEYKCKHQKIATKLVLKDQTELER